MTDLTLKSLEILLAEISSSKPTPGGGSACALAGVIGISLLRMACSVSSKSATGSDLQLLHDCDSTLSQLTSKLAELAEQDIECFQSYMDALSLPKNSEEERRIRDRALLDAGVRAAHCPLAAASVMRDAIGCALEVEPKIKRSVASDLYAGAEIIAGTASGILLNVDINLKPERMAPFRDELQAQRNSVSSDIRNQLIELRKSNA